MSGMKIYLQTDTRTTDTANERRSRHLVMETAASPDLVHSALVQAGQRLGAITVIPAPAHEHNLKRILLRDLAEFGVTPGQAENGEATLEVVRTPGQTGSAGQADVIGLAYTVTLA